MSTESGKHPLKHGIHVLVAYFITTEVNQKKKKEVFWRQLKHKWMGKVGQL